MSITVSKKILISFIALVAISLVVTSAISYTSASAALESEILKKMQGLLDVKKEKISDYHTDLKSDVALISKYFNVIHNIPILDKFKDVPNSKEFADATAILDSQLSEYNKERADIENVEILNNKGIILYATNPDEIDEIGDLLWDKIGAVSLDEDEIFTTPAYLDENHVSLHMLRNVFSQDGKHIGYINAEINLDNALPTISTYSGLGNTGESLLAMRTGSGFTFVNEVRHGDNPGLTMHGVIGEDTALPMQEAVQKISGKGKSIDYRGEPIIAAWDYIPGFEWGIVTKIDISEATADTQELAVNLLIINGTVIATTILISVIVSRSITKPINSLRDKVIRFGASSSSSSSSSSSYTGQSEIEILDKEFENMKQSVAKGIEDMKTIEQILDKAALVSRTDLKGDITYANEEFCKISGYSKEELIGKNHRIIKSGKHPDFYYKTIWDTITEGKTWRGIIQNKAKDGTLYWTISIIAPNRSKNNNGYTSIRVDITKQIEYENIIKEKIKTEREFTHIASHELRTPLQPMINFGEMAKEGIISKEDAINGMMECASQLEKITEDMLEVSRIESNTLKMNIEKFDIKEIIEQSVKRALQIVSKDIQIIKNYQNCEIEADRGKITQVIDNILSNAIKFTKKGSITIKVKTDESNITVSITDSGQGIHPDVLDKVFKKFSTKQTSDIEQKGTGLGMYISQKFIKGHHGTITAHNEKDHGATISFTIPKKQ